MDCRPVRRRAMATSTIRGSRPADTTTPRSPARVSVPRQDDVAAEPTVTGTIPAELDGSLLRAVRDPAWVADNACAAAQAPLLDGGLRLSGGLARWYRRATPAC